MSHSVQMPALGESVTEGTVTRWLKKEGDQVTEDEPLLEVSTDKVDTEVPAPYSGVLEKILVGEDETVDVGAELAIIGDGSGGGAQQSGGGQESGGGQDAPAPQHATDQAPASAGRPTEQHTEQPAEATAGQATEQPSEAAPPPSGGVSSDDAAAASGTEVTMPAMGESVTEGTVSHWLKQVGDSVSVDEPLVEIATDKVDAEVPSPVAGTLLRILAAEDATVEVGSPIAIIGDAGAAPDTDGGPGHAAGGGSAPAPEQTQPPQREPEQPREPERQADQATPAPAAPAPAPAEPAATAAGAGTPPERDQGAAPPRPAPSAGGGSGQGARPGGYVTPVVRKLAADHGVDLGEITGTGVGGRIRREDVLAAAEKKAAAAAPAPAAAAAPAGGTPAAAPGPVQPDPRATALVGTTQPAARIRQSIARNMLQAVTTSAQTTTVVEVDVSRVASLRARANAGAASRGEASLTFLPFFIKAAVEAAKVYPIVNASLSEDLAEITYHPTVNVGIEVDTPQGSVVPVIHQADDLSLTGLARRVADLAERTRRSEIGPNELSGATLTVSNAGSVGALFETAIFVPPQSASLVVGSVVKRPVVVTDAEGNDVIAVRSMAYLALSYDHRTIDGADAARYLTTVKKRIEAGDFDADLGL